MTAKEIEIMAPVGSYESLMAAIQGGANSVYFGIGKLNMRSRSSQNFTLDDLAKISSICHQNGLKSYITLNTIVYDKELAEIKQIINSAKENNISAIIASDPSVILYAHSQGVEVHMSTQTNITNIEAVKFWANYADVIVTARELTLKDVAAITKRIREEQITGPSRNLVQIEIFVHGALCMAVSGKCYLSLDTLNSSANRGACLQPCRRRYKVADYDNEVELEIDNEYIMSPKDLKTIHFLDHIIKAGVRVFKIEGRGRSADYVKVVSRCYREAVNAYFNGTYNAENIAKWEEQLETVYNRGFWDGYYLGKKLGEWTHGYGSLATKRKIYIGKVMNYFSKIGVAEIKLETHDLQIDDEIQIEGPTTGVLEDTVTEIRVDDQSVLKANKGESCSLATKSIVRRMDKVYKVVNVKPSND
ncbi:MAG: peptidase U32 family protein [Bacteroidales bacterium]|jgi:putative protease|nr:U32 family peptidase [Bacteroidales bacterium]MDI9592157.1 peptidase U32 family protein [Bacteroidota bacterium]NLH33560.1 U32 family peptidase [Lentimicrobium sp.]OQC38085.1 MAG: putative protease YhbU precursor [Bacteroidetes bacterium ADurb.Bin041]MBP7875108.1 U32 family peptidase [Bacteroidales bacterium]